MCVLFDAGWFPLHSTNWWKQAGGEGVYQSFTGVGDSAELIQVLSRDLLSVRWARAATHWDGAGLEKRCDVSIIKQYLRFLEKRENHAMYGALLTAVPGACWPKARVAGLLHVELDGSCVRCGAVRGDLQGGQTPWGSAVTFGTNIGMRSRFTPRQSRSSKSKAMSTNGRCGQGTSLSGCLRATSLPIDWRPRELKRMSIPSYRQENYDCQEFSQDGAEARCRCYFCTWPSSTATSPLKCPMLQSLGRVHRWKNASGCPNMR